MSRQGGVVTAFVRTLDDPEREGRVGIEYRWLPNGESLPTVYAPVGAALAGSDRGAFFMPEVDDEVLVAFDRGDWDHPYIVGFLWNGAHRPPEDDHQNRVILTPGGHTLRFEDGSGKKIVLRSDGDHELVLDDAGTATLRSAGGHEVVLDDAGSVTVRSEGGHEVVLDDPGSITIRSAGGHTLRLDDLAGSITAGVGGAGPLGASVTLRPDSLELSGGGHRVRLSAQGVQIT